VITIGVEYSFDAVPANHRLVIQHISGNINASGPITVTSLASFFSASPLGNTVVFDQPVLIYWDAGTTPFVQTQTVTGFIFSGLIQMTGYTLDCAAAPCAPIAQ
jgi:hypothetical protein